MEPNRRRNKIRRSGCPGTKRVSGRSRLAFGCHRPKLTQTKKRGRERDNKKSPKNNSNITRYIEEKERMHGNA